MLNTGVSPRGEIVSSLSLILEARPHRKYYLTPKACLGILRRAERRGKKLPQKLERALLIQSGLIASDGSRTTLEAYHINQRDEGIDLHGKSGALLATNNMQMQTFVTQPSDAEAFAGNPLAGYRESKVASTEIAGQGKCYNTLVSPAVFGQTQFGNYGDSVATLRAQGGDSGGGSENLVVCLNDQGGDRMDVSLDRAGTLRASAKSHEPLVYENHGIDARYTGPYAVSPTLSARCGTGGNNLPLVEDTERETFCISGNIVGRKEQNGGNGFGYQANIAYTLTATDKHAVWSETYQDVVGTLCSGDEKGAGDQYVSQDKCVVSDTLLIRRLTPLECERLQGFPDGWTDIPGATDSARYKALGNSVAIPCVEYIMQGVALALRAEEVA